LGLSTTHRWLLAGDPILTMARRDSAWLFLALFAVGGCDQKRSDVRLASSKPLASTATSSSSAAIKKPPPHPTGRPDVILGRPTGYVFVTDYLLVRDQIVECPKRIPRDVSQCTAPYRKKNATCLNDSECTGKPNGWCTAHGLSMAPCACRYGCTLDNECDKGEVCVCADPVGFCAAAPCMETGCERGVCALRMHSEGFMDAFECVDLPTAN
jgi:hypothetical protein